jgi:hypothetical protein
MPCYEPRDGDSRQATNAHHHRLEKMIDTWTTNNLLSPPMLAEYLAEKERYVRECAIVDKGQWRQYKRDQIEL